MKKFRVAKQYSYVDGRGQVHPQGTVLTLDETSNNTKCQLYKLESLEEPAMEKRTIIDKMITKKAVPELPKSTIKDRMQAMIKEQQEKKHD